MYEPHLVDGAADPTRRLPVSLVRAGPAFEHLVPAIGDAAEDSISTRLPAGSVVITQSQIMWPRPTAGFAGFRQSTEETSSSFRICRSTVDIEPPRHTAIASAVKMAPQRSASRKMPYLLRKLCGVTHFVVAESPRKL
jgi:hypothetical protein